MFIVIYLPGMPSSLAWPSEWLIVLAWYLIAAILYITQTRKSTTNVPVNAHVDKE